MRFLRAIFLLVFISSAWAQGNPPKLAGTARFDLLGAASVGALNAAVVLKGNASMERMNWQPAAEQPRNYTCSFSIVHFGWTEIVVQFTPQNSGTVDLSLMGPWEQSPNGGAIYRQEVLWDHVAGTNVTLANGSFETVSGGVPSGWFRPYGDAAVDSGALAVDGTRYARTWHDGQWRKTLSVTGGRVVTLRLFARAQTPAGFVDNPRIADANSPAHRARLKFMRGVNLGNYLEAPAGQNWGQTYGATDFQRIREEGFDHVRIPARWNAWTGGAPNYAINETFAQRVDALVNFAAAQGLGAIVNIHHFDEFTADPAAQTEKFYKLWEQIATRYAGRPDTVAFELLNEPMGAATTALLNPIYAEAIRRIRTTNPNRTVFIGPGNYNSISQLTALNLPADDANLIVTVHSYDPFLFTHQGATWTGDSTATTGVIYPGPPGTPLSPRAPSSNLPWVVEWLQRYNTAPREQNPSSKAAFVGNLEMAKMWSDYYGRPIHVGEFGCYEMADAASRANFYREMREEMDRLGLGWAMWDWKAGFKYWDPARNAPAPGMREAIFPRPVLKTRERGQVETDAAVGKRLRVLRSEDVAAPLAQWEVVSDAPLPAPALSFADPASPQDHAFYQVEWVK